MSSRSVHQESPLRVVDLFCGGGGISEGLRQAGFEILYAVDKDQAAVDTFAANHPGASVHKLDLSTFRSDQLPEFDVLVGGPPCIEFSMSKGSRRDVLAGLLLVQAFLRVVHERKPRYWIMENVPRVILHIPEQIPLSWIGIEEDGFLEVPNRNEFNCADFGVPQARRRFLMGKYPNPTRTHSSESGDLFSDVEGMNPWRTLGDVLTVMPDVRRGVKGLQRGVVSDPNYELELPVNLLTDHFHDASITQEEARGLRRAKQDHPYMGRMAFPDRLDRPARTVVATQLGRETLIIKDPTSSKSGYRRATVRECACLQAFPITYQFLGNSYGARYRIVGDAVPPVLTFRIGQQILQAEGKEMLAKPILPKTIHQPAPPPKTALRSLNRKAFRGDRKFSELVPGKEVRGCRAELDNQGTAPGQVLTASENVYHLMEWRAMLYVGEGAKTLRTKQFSVPAALDILLVGLHSGEELERLRGMAAAFDEQLRPVVADASTLQAVWTCRMSGPRGPESLVDLAAVSINRFFPASEFSEVHIKPLEHENMLPAKGIRIRIACGLLAAAYISELANHGLTWSLGKRGNRYWQDEWGEYRRPRKGIKAPLGLIQRLTKMIGNPACPGRYLP